MRKIKSRKARREDSLLEGLERRQLLSVSATAAAANVVVDGGTGYQFAAIFSSSDDVNPASIQPGDITISGPNGTITPTLVSVDPAATPSLFVTAVYKFTPPGGKWEMADNGTYSINAVGGAITDGSGSSLSAQSIGTFLVNIQPSVVLSDTTLVINGSGGPDTISVTASDGNLDVNEDGNSTLYVSNTIKNVSVIGGTATESINFGVSQPATILGTAGADTIIVTGSGRDVLDGLAGPDSIVGGSGNCTLKGAGGSDTLVGGHGNDSIRAGGGSNLIEGRGGNDTLAGGHGHDSILGGPGNDIIYAQEGAATINGGAGSDTVFADSLDDILSATSVSGA
jgi:Ca2+-binding RTX toxin-like protein